MLKKKINDYLTNFVASYSYIICCISICFGGYFNGILIKEKRNDHHVCIYHNLLQALRFYGEVSSDT